MSSLFTSVYDSWTSQNYYFETKDEAQSWIANAEELAQDPQDVGERFSLNEESFTDHNDTSNISY